MHDSQANSYKPEMNMCIYFITCFTGKGTEKLLWVITAFVSKASVRRIDETNIAAQF